MSLAIALLAALTLAALPGSAGAAAPGEKAPAFEAASTAGTIRLADYAGRKNVVLAFYYADFTPV